MERRFELRLQAMLDEAVFDPADLRGMLTRLERFVEPFAASLKRREQRENAHRYLAGLLSDVRRKNAEALAYFHDQERQGLQKFVGQCGWDERPLLDELCRQVAEELGDERAVIVIDPSAFPKKGTASVGVQRQWCGRLGKLENCQVGVYMGYVSSKGHALTNMRLYLPQAWASDKRRRRQAGVPKEVRFRTRHELALDMLAEQAPHLPHAWVAGDDEMGRSSGYRRELREADRAYLLGVPRDTLIREIEASPPEGRRTVPFQRVEQWARTLPETAWTRVEVRDGEKGPHQVQIVARQVEAKTDRRRIGPVETVVVIRRPDETGQTRTDYHLAWSRDEVSLGELARVDSAAGVIEQSLKRAKSEAGLADYQVRNWTGWHHHQVLSLIATWYLTTEHRRGKKIHTGTDRPAGPHDHRLAAGTPTAAPRLRNHLPQRHTSSPTKRTGSTLPLETAQPLATASR